MKIYYISDIHLEFYNSVPELVFPSDSTQSTLVLAGDIGTTYKTTINKLKTFIELCSASFKHVIYVFGNHEHYKYSIDKTHTKVKKELEHLSNVHVLECESIVLDGVKFYGATFWTDLSDPIHANAVYAKFNDFRYIRTCNFTRKFSTPVWDALHLKAKHMLENEKDIDVVVSHHVPVMNLLSYSTGSGDYGMSSNVGLDFDVKHWIYGHDHSVKQEQINDTMFVTNAHGYFRYEHSKDKIVFDQFIEVTKSE